MERRTSTEVTYRNSKYQNRIGYQGWCRGERRHDFCGDWMCEHLLHVGTGRKHLSSYSVSSDDSRGGLFSPAAQKMVTQSLAHSLPIFMEAARSVREYHGPLLQNAMTRQKNLDTLVLWSPR